MTEESFIKKYKYCRILNSRLVEIQTSKKCKNYKRNSKPTELQKILNS